MLRRRLLLNLGPLVALLAVNAVVAIWLLQGVLGDLSRLNSHLNEQGESLTPLLSGFRWLVLALAIVFVVVINLSVFILLRMGAMILRPMDKLIHATHELAQGHFEHRVQLDKGSDEFGQLADAFNRLAERLQSDEQRKMDMVSQTALALNHELNNCISIIELQLRLMNKGVPRNPAMEEKLTQIHGGLERMASALRSLKSVRRIVLTDYLPGMKMLDLERSVRDNDDLPPLDDNKQKNRAEVTEHPELSAADYA